MRSYMDTLDGSWETELNGKFVCKRNLEISACKGPSKHSWEIRIIFFKYHIDVTMFFAKVHLIPLIPP